MNEEICCITNKEHTAKNEKESDVFLWPSYCQYEEIRYISSIKSFKYLNKLIIKKWS